MKQLYISLKFLYSRKQAQRCIFLKSVFYKKLFLSCSPFCSRERWFYKFTIFSLIKDFLDRFIYTYIKWLATILMFESRLYNAKFWKYLELFPLSIDYILGIKYWLVCSNILLCKTMRFLRFELSLTTGRNKD